MDQHRALCSKTGFVRVFLAYALIGLLMLAPLAQAHAAQPSGDNAQGASKQTVSLDKLADLLENDKTRQQLITELRQAANHEQNGQPAAAAHQQPAQKKTAGKGGETKQNAAPSVHRMSFARQFAQTTAAWAETISSVFNSAWKRVVEIGRAHV